VGEGAPRLDRLRHYFNHPGFVEPNVDATLAALAELGEADRHDAHLLFVTHSVPLSMNDASGPDGGAYVAQHRSVVDEITERVRQETGQRYAAELVYCSRSGPPHVPWLDPRFVAMVRELLLERAAVERGEEVRRPALGSQPPSWDVCPAGCCANQRGARPALCGQD
jgi:protoheme ferro-lyase